VPLPPSTYFPGPVSPQQLNTDLYSYDGNNFHANGIFFHARRPVVSETVTASGTAYSPLAMNQVNTFGMQAYIVIDTTALMGVGADFPGNDATFHFRNMVAASSGDPAILGGYWLNWEFPVLGNVTVPPGGVGAGIYVNSVFQNLGTFQYGSTGHNNTPYYLDLLTVGAGTVNTWQPGFWWLTPSTPHVSGNATDTSGQVTRVGWAWQATSRNRTPATSIPSPQLSWGTVTSAALNNSVGSVLSFLNNAPALRVSAASGQSFTTNTVTVAKFQGTPDVDTYSGWSTANSVYTVPLSGLYLFSPTLVWGTTSTSGIRLSGLQVSAASGVNYQGPGYIPTPVGPGVTGVGLTASCVARVLSLNAGDTVAAYGLQNSGGALSLYTGWASRLIGAYMGQVAPAGSVLTYASPNTAFRWQAGLLSGTALTAALNQHLGQDLAFLMNRPYFTGYQTTAQTGFGTSTAFHQVTIDTIGALPRGGNGDNYGGWSTANSWYVSQMAGWYLTIADIYTVAPVSGTTGVLQAGIFCSSSGGITPTSTPDQYQLIAVPASASANPPGVTAIGLYYLAPGEFVYPMIQAQSWGSPWGTFVNASTTATVHSQFSCFWVSE
jgi:hypothetical protein